MEHERYMRQALQLAGLGRGQASPGPLVGALIVGNGEIVGQGAYLKSGGAYAEVHALTMAGDKARGATLYVTVEPLTSGEALVNAGIRCVVLGASHPDPAVSGQRAAALREAGIEVVEGILAEEVKRQNESFWVWATEHRPFVIWRTAATLDGYIATDSGMSHALTSEEASISMQNLRKNVAAIGVGIETVLLTNPELTVRTDDSDGAQTVRQPLRVIFDSRLRTPTISNLLSAPGDTLIYTTHHGCLAAGGEYVSGLERSGAAVVPITADEQGRVYLPEALQDLARRGVSSLLVEGGPTLVSSLIREQLIDKVHYYLSPKMLQSGIRPAKGPRTERMVEALSLDRVTYQQVSSDMLVTGYPRYDEKPRWWLGGI